MKNLLKSLEMIPVIGFGIAYFTTKDLQMATLVLASLMTVFMLVVRLCGEKLTKMQLLTWLITVLLTGVSFLTKDEAFFKWKVTVINCILACIFLFSHFVGEATVLERLGSKHLENADSKLRKLNLWTVGYFAFVAALNVVVVRNFDNDTWVNFKLFGIFGLNLIFGSACFVYLKEELTEYFNRQA